jgi:hypothetical protein
MCRTEKPDRAPAASGLATAPRDAYVPQDTPTGGNGALSQSFVQLVGFVVLGAIVLATGFGAIGAPPVLPGAF